MIIQIIEFIDIGILTRICIELRQCNKLHSYLINNMDAWLTNLIGVQGSNNKYFILSFGSFQTKEYMENELRYLIYILNQLNISILDMPLKYDFENK